MVAVVGFWLANRVGGCILNEMHDLKAKRLSEITDEVKQLHPLLVKLLPKLKNVKRVDYTHGNREMGADFVVTLENTTFATEYYAGVIAKVGNIDQASIDNLERQMKECGIERLSYDGRKTVTLSEIWIATNGTISANARDKINHVFSQKT